MYHYTTREKLIDILESKSIHQSRDGISSGVYFSELGPAYNQDRILFNLYVKEIQIFHPESDSYIKISTRHLKGLRRSSIGPDRRIWIYPNQSVQLPYHPTDDVFYGQPLNENSPLTLISETKE